MRTIRQFIDDRAAKDSEKIYMIAPEPGLTLTYGQLKEEAVIIGRHLLRLGISKGDKVSFMMGNGYQAAKIFLGTMYAGLVIAPLNLIAQPSQLEYVIDHSDTKLVFYTEDQKERLENSAEKVKRDIRLIQVDNDAEYIFPVNRNVSSITLPEVNEEDDALLL